MKFKLEIELGNEAMLTSHDIAEALRDVMRKLRKDSEDSLEEAFKGRIKDLNGNTVGGWQIEGQ